MQKIIVSTDENLRELTKHHTFVMPIACYKSVISNDNSNHIYGYVPLHWHEEIQFVSVLQGEGIFQVNEEYIELKEGDGLFINSGRLHMSKSNTSCTFICLNVSPHYILSQELYNIYVKPYIEATNLPYILINTDELWGKNILNAIYQIYQYIDQKPQKYEVDISIKLTFIWKNLIASGFQLEFIESEELKNNRVKGMLSWIHQYYMEKISLADIARAGQLSKSECCRYFKRYFKMSPLNYVIDYRIKKSLYLLQRSDVSVTEVAYQVGFNSTSYYISKFKEIMRTTPLAYQKKILNNGPSN